MPQGGHCFAERYMKIIEQTEGRDMRYVYGRDMMRNQRDVILYQTDDKNPMKMTISKDLISDDKIKYGLAMDEKRNKLEIVCQGKKGIVLQH